MKMFIFEMTLHGDAFATPLPVTAKVEAENMAEAHRGNIDRSFCPWHHARGGVVRLKKREKIG